MAGKVTMNSSVQLVFDANILVDAITARGQYYQYAVEVLEIVKSGRLEGWYAPQTFITVYYLVEKTLCQKTENQKQAAMVAGQQVKEMFSFLKPLPQAGDELLDIVIEPGDDLENLLIIRLANNYLPNPLFVTRDKWFLATGKPQAAHPKEILESKLKLRQQNNSNIPFIDLQTQQRVLRTQIDKNIRTVLHHGRYILGPEVKELETQLAGYTGAKHCIGVSSGTDALLIPLMANEIGPGDAVFTTPFTFIATAEVIQLLGATPVFVDIDPKTFNIDPAKLELAIRAVQTNDPTIHPLPNVPSTSPTLTPKAIIPVDLFGLPADYDPIMDLAEQHDLFVLADSAQGFGGEYKGRKTGNLAHATTTSFFPAKPLGCYGDGGAIFTNDDELAEHLESIRVHGKGRDKYDNIRTGLNARLHTIQAAILLAKLQIFPQELTAKQNAADRYTELLTPHSSSLQTPHIPQGIRSAWAQYSILAKTNEIRNKIQTTLKDKSIPSMVYYTTPLHAQTAYTHLGYQPADFPLAMNTSKRILSLPMHAHLTDHSQGRIISAIIQAIG